MPPTVALIGDTVKLRGTFTTFAGELGDPSTIQIQIYDHKEKPIGEPIAINPSEYRVSVGVYEYPYIIPPERGSIFAEFTGNLEGFPAKSKVEIEKVFI